MFKSNKYKKWYFDIINKYKNIISDGVGEKHHIIPKSMGGKDDDENLVLLSPRVHYICHWLLTKMTEGNQRRKMTFALHTFFHFNKYRKLNFNSRQYEFHKKKFAEACKERVPITKKDVYTFKKEKTNEIFVGTRNQFKNYSKISAQDINWLVNHCFNPNDPKKIIKGWGIWIDSMQDYSYNKHRPPMPIELTQKIVCEHCNKTSSLGNYRRWHGDRCKIIDSEGHYERTRQVANINVDR